MFTPTENPLPEELIDHTGRSEVWDYYKQHKKWPGWIFCLECIKKSQKSWIKPQSSSTSPMIHHLAAVHKIKIEKIKRKDLVPTPRIDDYFLPVDRNKKITHLIVDWIVDDSQAFSVVDKQSFKAVISEASKGTYSTIGSDTVRRELQKKHMIISRLMKGCFRQLVEDETLFGITLDHWTSGSNENYMNVTAHWINDVFELETVTIDFSIAPATTGWTVRSMVKKALMEWALSESIARITVDGASMKTIGSNLVARADEDITDPGDFESFKYPLLWCVAHRMSWCVNEGLKKSSTFTSSITTFREELKCTWTTNNT